MIVKAEIISSFLNISLLSFCPMSMYKIREEKSSEKKQTRRSRGIKHFKPQQGSRIFIMNHKVCWVLWVTESQFKLLKLNKSGYAMVSLHLDTEV